MSIMWLTGALDQATVTLLDHELGQRANDMTHLVVDLTGLAFIDSAGLNALVGIDWRVSERDEQLSFRRDDDFSFALALACVDVGHLPPGDRPEAA